MIPGSTGDNQIDEVRTLGDWRHDMKNQLGIILGFADLMLQETDATDPRRADIGEIRNAAARAMELLVALKSPCDE
jgi:signal transduction histidine kinase